MSASYAVPLVVLCLLGSEPRSSVPIGERLELLKSEVERSIPGSVRFADDTLAVAIEWIRMRDSVLEGPVEHKADFFWGFLTGRLQTSPPDWWRYEIRHGNVYRDGHIELDFRRLSSLWKTSRQDRHFSGVDNLEIGPNRIQLENALQRVVIDSSNFVELEGEGGGKTSDDDFDRGFSVAIDRDICAMTFHKQVHGENGGVGPTSLYCVDASTGKTVWKADLVRRIKPPKADKYSRTFLTPPGSFTQLVIEDTRIFVWSIDNSGACMEVFEKATGNRLMTFATYLLDGIRLPVKSESTKPQ